MQGDYAGREGFADFTNSCLRVNVNYIAFASMHAEHENLIGISYIASNRWSLPNASDTF